MKEIKSQDHLDNMARQGTPRRLTAADCIADAGELLYGPHWRKALAIALHVKDSMMWRWMNGKSAVPAGVIEDVLTLLQIHDCDVFVAIHRLRESLKKASTQGTPRSPAGRG